MIRTLSHENTHDLYNTGLSFFPFQVADCPADVCLNSGKDFDFESSVQPFARFMKSPRANHGWVTVENLFKAGQHIALDDVKGRRTANFEAPRKKPKRR
jgi:hypothetical protein